MRKMAAVAMQASVLAHEYAEPRFVFPLWRSSQGILHTVAYLPFAPLRENFKQV